MRDTTGTHAAESAAPSSPELLMLREAGHRHANDLACAIATLRLVQRGLISKPGISIQAAIERLEGSVSLQRALGGITFRRVSLNESLERLCADAAKAQLAGHRVTLRLADEDPVVDPMTNWRVGAAVAELLTNAAKHGLREPGGTVRVEVNLNGPILSISVEDQGAPRRSSGSGPSSSGGHGGEIVAAIVGEMGGTIARFKRPGGSRAVLRLPLRLPA